MCLSGLPPRSLPRVQNHPSDRFRRNHRQHRIWYRRPGRDPKQVVAWSAFRQIPQTEPWPTASGTDGWTTYSSRRWKTNIQTLHGALAKVEQLRGVSYELKDSGKHEVGVIAEEVGEVVPEVVSYEVNGKDARGVDYSRLTALLIEATKEQQREFRKEQAELAKALRQIKQQQSLLRAQAAAMRSLETQVREDRETLRKVKAQVATFQPALVAAK
jgi:endosialidase-like protein